MRQAFAPFLLAIANAGAGHSHGPSSHVHGEAVNVEVVKNDKYHQKLTYEFKSDKFGDTWVHFESELHSEAAANNFQDGWFISQWYAIEKPGEDGTHHDDDHGHDHRFLDGDHTQHRHEGDDGPQLAFETVQATLKFDKTKTNDIPEANVTLQQGCGVRLQESWGNAVNYAERIETPKADQPCSPWSTSAASWTSSETSVTAKLSRKLKDAQVSEIELKAGEKYHYRGGYFVQKTATNQELGYVETEFDMYVEGSGAAYLAIGAALLSVSALI